MRKLLTILILQALASTIIVSADEIIRIENPSTAESFKEIIEGKYDALNEQDFYMKGGIEEVE